MDGTIVFIFLLDHLPENILNKTLETVDVTHVHYSDPNTCDYAITDPLLQVISRELEVLMVPKWLFDERSNSSHTNSAISNFNVTLKSHLDTNKVIDSSLEGENPAKIEHTLIKSEYFNEETKNVVKKAPLLAAIFESLSNVTAQTCGGTVVAPHWVLTAASCINLLSNLKAETTNITEKSVYTVIINATDPLIDGSAHNVTEVHLHPNDSAKIALMRIEPAVKIEEVVYGDIEDGAHVSVYGWSTKKLDSDHDMMAPISFEAVILSPEDCSTHYNITAIKSELCMATTEENAEVVSQLSWGGPVVSPDGIVAVSRGDGHAPLAGWSLASHLTWIHATALNH